MNTKRIDFKWTTSRGQDTYGYNICSLYLNGIKQNQNCGGGYDMRGTALADYIQDNYQDRLLKLHRRANCRYSVSAKYKRLSQKDRGLYGMTSYYHRGERKPFKIGLDGGCGFNSIDTICKIIGLKLIYTGEAKTTTTYIIEDAKG